MTRTNKDPANYSRCIARKPTNYHTIVSLKVASIIALDWHQFERRIFFLSLSLTLKWRDVRPNFTSTYMYIPRPIVCNCLPRWRWLVARGDDDARNWLRGDEEKSCYDRSHNLLPSSHQLMLHHPLDLRMYHYIPHRLTLRQLRQDCSTMHSVNDFGGGVKS